MKDRKKVVIVTQIELDSKDYWKELVADIAIHAIIKKDGVVTRKLISTQDGVEVKNFPQRKNTTNYLSNYFYNQALSDIDGEEE